MKIWLVIAMIRLGDLFEVKYGVNLELNKLKIKDSHSKNTVNFVSRTAKNNGVSAIVEKIEGLEPIPAGTLSVAGGGSVLSTFLQPEPYYSGRDLYYLTSIIKMTDAEKIFYCMCIEANKYRYNYGRQANKTLKDILVPSPDEIPSWVYEVEIPDYSNVTKPYLDEPTPALNVEEWKEFRLDELFDIEVGKGPSSKFANKNAGNTPFVSATENNNGVTNFTSYEPTHERNTITVSRNGSIGESFYQPVPFCATADVAVLNPRFNNNQYISLFIATILKQEKYKYNYSRKWNLKRMKETIIRLPATPEGNPDWEWMEKYVKTLSVGMKKNMLFKLMNEDLVGDVND